MEINRICDVIVDHFMMKKETICHMSVIWDTEVMKPFTQSARHIVNRTGGGGGGRHFHLG